MLLYAYFSVSKKRNIKRSRNGTKSTGEVIFVRKPTGYTWTLRQKMKEVLTRVGGMPTLLGRAPCLVPPPFGPPTYSFHPYIPTYPKTSRTEIRSGVPPPQASVATKSQPGPCSVTLPEGGSLTGGHLHHLGALHDEEGLVHPRAEGMYQ